MNSMSEGKVAKAVARSGCLLAVAAPLLALLIYPAAKWLFLIPLVLLAVLMIASRFRKDPTPNEVAEFAEKLLDGQGYGYDVDDYEHLNPRNPPVRELWRQTMSIGGLPEEWPSRDDATKKRLRDVIASLRELSVPSDTRL